LSDILKTWPAFMDPRKVLMIFGPKQPFGIYYFTLGRGKPQQEIEHIWFTYRGRVLGNFKVDHVVCNVGQIPQLRRIDGGGSAWQIKRDRFVAVCLPPFQRVREHVYHDSFRGWRYFNFEEYSQTLEAKIV
jgi:hypothetical protein